MFFYQSSKNVNELNLKDFKINSLKTQVIPNDGESSLVIFYAHWCPHCTNKNTIKFVEALGSVLPKKTGIKVCAFNAEASDKHRGIAYNVNVRGFPTFSFYNKKNGWNNYRGPMEVKPLIEFLLSKS